MKSHSTLYGFPVRRYKLGPGRRKTGSPPSNSLLSFRYGSRWQAMHDVIRLMAEWGLLAVFVGVLLDEGGLPIPCFPILVVAGAATATGHFSLPLVILLAVAAAVLADLFWYWAGKRFGRRILSLLCRLSLAPDSCVRQTEDLFTRVGPWSLLFVRYVPGLSNITVAMAAITPMPLSR